MIHFQNAAIGYNRTLLEVEDLTLQNENVFALVGRNGSGKSTLLRSITGQIPLLAGKLTIDSIPIAGANASELSRTVAFVESKFDGVPYLSVADYLALGRAPYTNAIGRLSKFDWEVVHIIAAEMGLTSFLEKDTSTLSDGERQLCAISRALVQQTPVLLLDEPTAFLDYANKQLLIDKLLKIASEKNKCIIFSTHDLDLCIENKVEFLLLNNRQLLSKKCETKEELITSLEREDANL